jgi:hypothetical protein
VVEVGLTDVKLDDRRGRANTRPPWPAILGCALLLAACTGAEPPGPQGLRADGYPDLRSVPAPPTLEDESLRRATGNVLLADLQAQRHAAEELRFRVGLLGSPPPPPGPPPVVPPPEVEALPPPVPSDGLLARYLRQQIRAELDTDSVSNLMDRVATEPIDLAALEAAGEPPSRRRRKGREAPAWLTEAPPDRTLLDRALVGIGLEAPDP